MKQELWCNNGGHKWKREAKRGRKPLNCPEHPNTPPVKKDVKPVNAAKNLEKAREAKVKKAQEREQDQKVEAQAKVETLRERVEKAREAEEKAYARLKKSPTPKNQDEWLKLDGRLMAEVTALRAQEAKL